MEKRIYLITVLLLAFTLQICAQNDVRATRPLTKWERKFGEVRYKQNLYQKGSNWFTVGFGPAYHLETKNWNQSIALAYHHRFRGVYFNAGWHFSSSKFINFKPLGIVRSMQMLNDIHAGGGLRFEGRWYHMGFFIGPSFATTWVPDDINPKISRVYHQLGAHVELQLIFKYLYDMGIGTSLYGSFNKRYQVAGIQLNLYFSNAFKSKY